MSTPQRGAEDAGEKACGQCKLSEERCAELEVRVAQLTEESRVAAADFDATVALLGQRGYEAMRRAEEAEERLRQVEDRQREEAAGARGKEELVGKLKNLLREQCSLPSKRGREERSRVKPRQWGWGKLAGKGRRRR